MLDSNVCDAKLSSNLKNEETSITRRLCYTSIILIEIKPPKVPADVLSNATDDHFLSCLIVDGLALAVPLILPCKAFLFPF